MGRVVYLNGSFVNEMEATISIYDSALMFGDMVFEMTRTFKRNHFHLEQHVERLFQGLKILRIDPGISKNELIDICHETCSRNERYIGSEDEHRLMINVSRGPLGIYAHLFGEARPTVVVADFPLSWTVSGLAHLVDEGINAVVPSQRAIPAHLMDPKIKNRSRLFYQMANIQVSQVKGSNNWALLVDPEGHVAEGTGNNFFIVKDGKVLTPRGENILRGISRGFVLSICTTLGIEAEEVDLEIFDVYTADEAFVTATPFCMLPVVSLDGVRIGDERNRTDEAGAFGPISSRIISQWSAEVGIDVLNQMRGFRSPVMSSSPTPYQFAPKESATD